MFDMADTWGDGWNGNKWNGFGKEFTLATGKNGSKSFTVPGAAPVTENITCKGGNWKTEISWKLHCNKSGDNVATGAATNGKSITL